MPCIVPCQRAPSLKGKLTITVIRAQRLSAKSSFGNLTTYCALKIDSQKQKTEAHVNGGITPEWNEELSL